jgi:trehalose-phosphatase
MTESAEGVLSRLLDAHRERQRLALFFDYDGTLAPIAAHPRLARLPDETRALLRALARATRVSVGVLSGRGLRDVKERVALPELYYVGSGGLEIDLRTLGLVHPGADEALALMRLLLPQLADAVRSYSGAWVEDKDLCLTVHYRAVSASQGRPLRAAVQNVLLPYAARLRALEGPMSVEILPAVGWNKGAALEICLSHLGTSVVPFYAGDDANDAEACATANQLGGISVGVGPRSPASARYRVPNSEDLFRLLSTVRVALASTPEAKRVGALGI